MNLCKTPVVIFGIRDLAELAHYYFTNDSEYEVVAFTADARYCNGVTNFHNLPVIPFDWLRAAYPPNATKMFCPVFSNKSRRQIVGRVVAQGYKLVSYISSKATVLTHNIGKHCFIMENNTIQPFVTIGDDAVIWSGNHIGHHSKIGNNVFISSHVVISGNCDIGDDCFLGVNSTIIPGIKLDVGTKVDAGAIVSRSTDQGQRCKAARVIVNDVD